MSALRGVGAAIACGLVLAGCSPPVPDPKPPTARVTFTDSRRGFTERELVTAEAKVEAIDQKSRVMTLKRASGERLRFRVSDDVKNLGQVKKGELVDVAYYESVALQLRKSGDASPGVAVAEAAERAKPGELPAGAVAEIVTVTATVAAIDHSKRTATLELPNNQKLRLRVDDAGLERLKVGDLVEATYREAIAVSVEAPGAPDRTAE